MSENGNSNITAENEMEDIYEEIGETSEVKVISPIIVSWKKKKQMNDIWRAFDLVKVAFEVWGIQRASVKVDVQSKAKQYYDVGGRYYAKKSGEVTLNDNGTFTVVAFDD